MRIYLQLFCQQLSISHHPWVKFSWLNLFFTIGFCHLQVVQEAQTRNRESTYILLNNLHFWIVLSGAHPAFILGSVLLCPVVGRSRLAVVACCTVRSGVFHHWIHHLWPQGAFPPGFNPLRRGWVYRPAPEAPRKGECRRGPRHFWNCLSRWATALRQDPP